MKNNADDPALAPERPALSRRRLDLGRIVGERVRERHGAAQAVRVALDLAQVEDRQVARGVHASRRLMWASASGKPCLSS